jgi:hypothetical protein
MIKSSRSNKSRLCQKTAHKGLRFNKSKCSKRLMVVRPAAAAPRDSVKLANLLGAQRVLHKNTRRRHSNIKSVQKCVCKNRWEVSGERRNSLEQMPGRLREWEMPNEIFENNSPPAPLYQQLFAYFSILALC